MSGYILAVAGAVLLSAALTAILPSGKMGEFIKGMLHLVMLAVIVAPLISLMTEQKFALPAGSVGTDAGYLAACARLLSEEDENNISAYVEQEFSLSSEVKAEREPTASFPLRKITVKVYGGGISGQEAHINMAERIREALSRKFGEAGTEVEVLWCA